MGFKWKSRLINWIAGAVTGALITISVSQYYYDLSARAAAQQMHQMQTVIAKAVRLGIVSAKYNAQGRVTELLRPMPPHASIE